MRVGKNGMQAHMRPTLFSMVLCKISGFFIIVVRIKETYETKNVVDKTYVASTSSGSTPSRKTRLMTLMMQALFQFSVGSPRTVLSETAYRIPLKKTKNRPILFFLDICNFEAAMIGTHSI